MSVWYCKNLGDATLAYLELEQIQAVCSAEFAKSNRSEDFAVLSRHESEGRLQCEVKVYFSPSLADTAKALGATPCEQPSRCGMNLLVGSPEAWSIFFPESKG
jgi:hypothetical protein